MNILVITPTEIEYKNFKNALKSIPHSNHYKVLQTGIGKVAAAAATAVELFGSPKQYDLVAVIGYAGGCSRFQQGDFIVPSHAVQYDIKAPKELVPNPAYVLSESIDKCTVLTGDCFVTSENYKEISNHTCTPNYIFDMESAAICQIAEDVPVIVAKIISDIPANTSTVQTYEDFVATHSNFSQFLFLLEQNV